MKTYEKDFVKRLQMVLNQNGERLTVDGVFGPKTLEAYERNQIEIMWKGKAVKPEIPKGSSDTPPWLTEAKKHDGRHETRDKSWAKWMASKWKLVGLDLPHISKSWSAWCGLAIAVALAGVGLDYQKNGATARNWRHYGTKIDWKVDGIPQGAIVHLNNKGNCNSSSSNHVSMANGNCTPEYLNTRGSTIDLYGGNQGNTWKVSTYAVSKICNVRWPKDAKDFPKPSKVLKNKNCSSGAAKWESTR